MERALEDFSYETLSGSHLFDFLNSKLSKDSRFKWVNSRVQTVQEFRSPSSGKMEARVHLLSGEVLGAEQVLSSPAMHESPVLQYFLGFEIETTSNSFDPETLDLMDFRVDQGHDVRFIYILPFSPRRALVEYTVFSESKLSNEECEAHLRQYLANHWNLASLTILKTESGVIPMSEESVPLFPPAVQGSCVKGIGSAASQIKPSTGYSFRRNLLAFNGVSRSSFFQFRFRIYDSILLEIIRKQGGKGAEIFFHLFSRNSPELVFSFLDEKTSIQEEIRIFWSLPWGPFLFQCALLYPYLISVIATIAFQQAIGGWGVWIIPLLGLATTGIGHGSLDPLTRTAGQSRFGFFIRYLGFMLGFLLCWKVFPVLAILFFIFVAADHFGEAEWLRPLMISKNDFKVRLLAWIWGMFASIFPVLFHWDEALPLIQAIAVDFTSGGSLVALGVAKGFGVLLFFLALGSAWYLDSYDHKASGRNPNGVLGTLILAIFYSTLPLLPGFFCFFAFWHAWGSIRVQRSRMRLGHLEYMKKAFPLTLLAWIGIGLLFGWSWVWDRGTSFWTILFVMIGALTTAHAPVMSRFLLKEARGSRKDLEARV